MKVLAILTATSLLAACAGGSGTFVPSQGGAPALAVRSGASVPACKGQSTTSEYATSASVNVGPKAGALCVPAFGGFGGTIEYPAAEPAITAQSISSTTNYNQTLPTMGKKGTPIFYLQVVTSGPVVFGKTSKKGGGLAGKALKAGKTYTVYGEAKLAGVAGITMLFTPCRAIATAGRYGGIIAGIGSLLAAQDVGSQAVIYVEVYSGNHAKTSC